MPVSNFDAISVITPHGTSQIADGAITTAKLTAALQAMPRSHVIGTIPTAAGTTSILFVAPYAGTLTAAGFASHDALTANDTNFVTFALVNRTNANAAMLAATNPNTSKLTGGAAIVANTLRTLTLSGTPANLAVGSMDILEFQVTGSGTLANTLTLSLAVLTFTPS